MFYDNRYDDNVVLRREAFQNLLTNIKNYPIVDIDFVDENEQDEIHNNNIWKDYTDNTPCLKITYGDSSTEKGNTMFASHGQRTQLYQAKKELEKLKRELNNRIYRQTKLKQARENNVRFLDQEKQQLERIKSKVDLITEKKEAYLMACLSVLYFPYDRDSRYSTAESLWDTNGGPLSNARVSFTYQTFSLEYNPNIAPKHETVVLTYSQLKDYSWLLNYLNIIRDNQTNEQYDFNEDERNFFNNFIEFLHGYNYLSFVESLELQGFTQQEIEGFKNDKQNSSNGVLTDDSWNKIHQKFVEIFSDPQWQWKENSTPDFPAMINSYKNNIENIITKIIGDDEHPGIIKNNINMIEQDLKVLEKGDNVNSDIILNNPDDYKDSIAYQQQLIRKQQIDITNIETKILNPAIAQDKMVYGYKYIRLDTNIKFIDNFDSYINFKTTTDEQKSGTFRININNNGFEVPIKGFGAEVSHQDIYIRTEKKDNHGGKINFLGNVLGQGNIITNRGHIYASQGSVAAAGFLALKSSIDRTDNVAGFRYNGTKHLFETFDITGHALYNNEAYSTNLKDYELVTLPDVDTGYIYIQQEYAHNETNTIDASKEDNRLNWQGAKNLETTDINNKIGKSLSISVRKIDENNLNTYYEQTKTSDDLNTTTEFNKNEGIKNQNAVILDVEGNTVVIKITEQLTSYYRTIKTFRPTVITRADFNNCASYINNILHNLNINEIEAVVEENDNQEFTISNYQNIINTLNMKLNDETLTNIEKVDIQNGLSDIQEEYTLLQTNYEKFKGGEKRSGQKKGRWVCLNFRLSNYTENLSSLNLRWSYNIVNEQDIVNAKNMGLTNNYLNLVFWLNVDKYKDIIKVTLTPSEDSGKIPTSFFIRYDGIDNSIGEIGEYANDPQEVKPIINKLQFYTPTTSRTDLIKFSTSQLYLTKKNMKNENISATLKINPDDNYIEAYEVDPNYNDSSNLASLRFQDADIKGNAYIDGTLTISDRAIFDTRSIYLRLPSVARTITPANNESDLGDDSNYWKNIYGANGVFDNIYLNGTLLKDVLPLNNSLGDSTQFWRGKVREDKNGKKTLPGWTNELTGQLILSNENGATGSAVPTNSTLTTQAGAVLVCEGAGYFGRNLRAAKVFNAVFNDYAEYRQTINLEPGRVVIDNDDGSLSCASTRLQPGAQIISDTFGHAMGFTDNCQTPLAVAGRVLVYPYQDKAKYHAGMAVCSGPNGTVDIMTREEIKEYPDCIIGIVSEIPEYDTWGSDNIQVNNRIWIKIK